MQQPQVQSHGPLRVSSTRLSYFLHGIPLFLLLAWVTKAFTPDLRAKSALMSRDLELRLEIVSSGAALWKQLLLPLFTVACLVWIIRSRKVFSSYLNVLIPVMLMGGFLLVSCFWSESPDDTLRRAIRQVLLFTSVGGAVVLARSQDRFVIYIQAFSLCLLVYEAAFLLLPHISFDIFGNFTGLHPAKNEFGGIAGAFLLISLCVHKYYAETLKEKRIALFCIIGWSVLLLISGSKTPMGFVVLLFPLVILSKHLVRYVSVGVIALWLFILVLFPMILIGVGETPIEFYRSLLPEDALTGRTGIWFHLLTDIKKDWMFGTAYGAYWGVGDVPEALDIKWSYYRLLHTAHSGFVDLVLELGVIPTVFWLLALWVFLSMTRDSADPLSTVVVAYAMLHNCLETSFLHGTHFVWVLMLMGIMNILYSHAHRPDHRSQIGSISIPPAAPRMQGDSAASYTRKN